jgi:hypothetical protein
MRSAVDSEAHLFAIQVGGGVDRSPLSLCIYRGWRCSPNVPFARLEMLTAERP